MSYYLAGKLNDMSASMIRRISRTSSNDYGGGSGETNESGSSLLDSLPDYQAVLHDLGKFNAFFSFI